MSDIDTLTLSEVDDRIAEISRNEGALRARAEAGASTEDRAKHHRLNLLCTLYERRATLLTEASQHGVILAKDGLTHHAV